MNIATRLLAALAAALVVSAEPLRASTPWHEGFEGPQSSWREAGSDAQYRILRHERVHADARSGTGCEMVTIEGSMGTYVHVEHAVGRPPVIDELRPSVWIRADRAGLQIAARVVLPRTPDPRTGTPVSTLVHGSTYTNVGRWQQLFIDDVPQRVARQVRVLRAELGSSVDGREVFVDAIVLNVYGGPGVTNVWIDDLEIAGHVAGGTADESVTPPFNAGDHLPKFFPEPGTVGRPAVAVSGGVLTVDGRAFFPRAIQYRGEPLEQLIQLGFNTVWLDSPPPSPLLADAARHGVWLICPPPDSLNHAPADAEAVGQFEIGSEYDVVLAWFLGRALTAADLEPTRLRVERVRAADRNRKRPIVCSPVGDLRGYSRHVDILVLDRRPIGSSLELRDYGLWVQRQPRLARPGTPIWTTVQTQPSAALYEQLASLEPGRTPPTVVPHEQVAMLAQTALGAGSRGLLFLTESDFLGADRSTRHRAMILELLNAELSLLEPWVGTGTFQASIEARPPELAGAVLRVPRSRLAMPLWSSAGSQYVPDVATTTTVSFVVPGVPESVNAFEIVPGGLGAAKHRRVTGGMQLTLDGFGLWSSVVLVQDALLTSQLGARARAIGPRASQLYRDLAAEELHLATETTRELPANSIPAAEASQRLREAQEHLRRSDAHLAARQYQQAIQAARQTMRAVAMLKRSHWEAAAKVLSSPVTSLGACTFASLPAHWRMGDRIQASQYGENQLAGGDFERLELLLQAGWQHMENRVDGCLTSVDLATEAARSGNTGLRLTARPEDPTNPPAVVETPPVWIVTPPIPVEAGQLVVIHGYGHVPTPIEGSVDGLLIFDSLSGESLAERIGRTRGWRPFTLFRVAPRSGTFRVTFALTGLGEARIDNVSIRALHPATSPVTARLPGTHVPR
ncbi:MAG: hypothetical protein RBS80_07190 [Thermoguttaceae bacterium]|jgi:hypothetical protein|nr:hypothetical protein [Thermoguttaceae bacterium]